MGTGGRSPMKTAIITGINGQDGFYLSKLLLEKGYKVVGVQRRTSASTAWRLVDLPNYEQARREGRFLLEAADITDPTSIARIVMEHKPQEFYNLAAQRAPQASDDACPGSHYCRTAPSYPPDRSGSQGHSGARLRGRRRTPGQ